MPPRGTKQSKPVKAVVVKKKAAPLPVPSLTIAYQNPPPKPKVLQPVGPEPKGKKKKTHLPTEYEYLPPEQFANRALGVETAAEKRKARQQNQQRERERRDEAKAAKAAERRARDQRRAAVRAMPEKTRGFIGKKKLQHFVQTGEGLEPGIMSTIGDAVKSLRPGHIYSAVDWWINKAPEAVLGTHKDGGYEGGLAEAWDKMSTQEQIDTIAGGKSLANVLQGQNLTPGNIGRAIALAAAAPIPWGKGLPSLASTLLRAGFSAPEVKTMLQTGKGLREALAATKAPVRPVKRAKAALAGKTTIPNLVPPTAADAAVVARWKPDAARIARDALARAEHMPVVVLHGPQGPRAIAAYVMQGDSLVIRELAGEGKGGGRAMMKELAREAASKGAGIRLIAETEEAAGFYKHIGMSPMGKKGYVWTPEEAATFAADVPEGQLFEAAEEVVDDTPAPDIFRFTRDEAEELPTVPGVWYHGTTAAAADEIESTGVLKVGHSDPPGAWLTSDPKHAAFFGDTVIMVPESMIPAEAERVSAFGGMVSSQTDIPLRPLEAGAEAGVVSPVSRGIAAEIHGSGLALPPELDTQDQLARAIEDVFEMAKEGEAGKDWYKTAAQGVMRVADHLALPPQQVAQLFAIFSQAADTVSNATFVFDAARQFAKFEDLFSGRFPVAQSKEAMAVLQGGQWEGRKRSSFYANMLRHIPGMEEEYAQVIKAMAEARGAPIQHPVTVDRWVVRMFRPNVKKDVPEQYYDTFETIMQRMAQQLGWEPEQIQAAAWVSMKSRALKAELAKKGRQTVRHKAGGGDAFEYGINKQLDLEAQGALFKGLETTPQARRLANAVNKKWGGFTVNRDFTPVPETGYSVTLSLTEETYPLHKIKAADIEQFKERYKALLRDSRNKIGGFADDANDAGDGTDVSYLSVTRHFPSDSAQSKAAAVRFARSQGQETVYEYKTGDGIRTGLTRDEQRDIIAKLDPSGTRGGPVAPLPPSSAETEYRRFLDEAVRGSGKGKRGVTDTQRADVEAEFLKYAERYPDDPELDEFRRLYETVNPVGDDDIPWGEAGRFSLAGFREKAPVRELTYGGATAQMQGARSAVTRQLIQKPADWTSAKLATEEGKAAAVLNRIFPTASARARVPKQLGRQQVIEASRAQARMMNHIHALPGMNSAEDTAHFYWAQLPSDLRNAEGLTLVRTRQAEEVERITSGEALEAIEAQVGAVRAQLRENEDLALLRELEDLKVLATDLPLRLEDLTKSIARLDKIIAKPPKYDEKIVAAVRGLSEERKRVLVEAGALDPDKAAAREGLVSSWVGVEPTGEEAYIGHRLGRIRGAQSSLMPVSPGVGQPRTPQGTRSKNQLVLARTGRLRASTHVAAEDWQAAQTYQSAMVARDDLAAMGTQFTGRLPEGHLLVNPKGRVVPAHWKSDHLDRIEEMDDAELRAAATDLMDTFVADGDNVDAMLAKALEDGVHWDELRVIPDDVVKRYYGQFTPAAGTTRGGKAYDAAVDFTAASIVFARVGYIPKNIAQNLIISVPHQGPFMLVNVPRAAQALLDPDLRHFLHAEVGFSGAAHGIGQELRHGQKLRGLPGKTAGFVGKIADDPARFAAFIHEAAAEGVIPKYKAHLSADDREALMNLFENPEMRPVLNDIRSRSVEAMADFSRLTPTQRRWARRFLIIPGWLWAGSRYPFHFAATHPGRSAALVYVAAGAPGAEEAGLPDIPSAPSLFADNLPDFVEGITLPDSFPIFGGDTFRTTSLSPVSTPYEIALALGGQSPDTAATYANPLAKAIWNISNQRVEYPGGSYQTGYQESIIRNLERIIPNWTFAKQMVSPEESSRYPEDETRLGRFFRELGVVPIQIRGDSEADTDEWVKEAERLSGGPVPPHVVQLRKTYTAHQAATTEYETEHGIDGGMTPQERLSVLALTVAKLDPSKQARADQMVVQASTMTDEEAEKAIEEGRERLGLTQYERIQSKLAEARVKARTHTGMKNGGQHD